MRSPYILVAPNGARRTKRDHPKLPISISEIVDTAKSCFSAGANGIHAHVRNSEGLHVLDAGLYVELIAELGVQVPEMDVQITTEAVGIYSPAQQIAVVRDVRPKMVSVALSELKIHTNKQELSEFYFGMQENGVDVQHIMYDPDELQVFEQMVDQNIIPFVASSFLFVLGRYTVGQVSSPQQFDPFLTAFENSPFAAESKIMACAFGSFETSCLLHAMEQGGDCRIGFENNLRSDDGQLAVDNAARVAELVACLVEANKL